jgi:hypothetical protein
MPDFGKRPTVGPAPPKREDENRGVHRQRTLKRARVLLSDSSTIDCTIRDISQGGARLVFGDAFELPETFRLMIVMSSMIVPVRLQWQRGMEAGVAFTGPEEPAHTHGL